MNLVQKKLISITGDLGSGKSTVSRMLSTQLSFEHTSTGEIQRSMASKYRMSTLELNEYATKNPQVDREIDAHLIAFGKAEQQNSLVVDSRLAWHFLPKSLKVFLYLDVSKAADRVIGDSRQSEEYESKEEAVEKLLRRKKLENSRFLSLYGIDCGKLSNYDLVIDTSEISAQEVCNLIILRLEGPKQGTPKLWLSPKTIFPSQHVRSLGSEDALSLYDSIETHGFNSNFPVEVVFVEGSFFLVDGHRRTAAALRSGVRMIPAELLATDDEECCGGVSAKQFVSDSFRLHQIYDWEDCLKFRFGRYPQFDTQSR